MGTSFPQIFLRWLVSTDRSPDLDDFDAFHRSCALPRVVTPEIGRSRPARPATVWPVRPLECRWCALLAARCLRCALPDARCLLTARYLLPSTAARCVPGRRQLHRASLARKYVRAPSHCPLPALRAGVIDVALLYVRSQGAQPFILNPTIDEYSNDHVYARRSSPTSTAFAGVW